MIYCDIQKGNIIGLLDFVRISDAMGLSDIIELISCYGILGCHLWIIRFSRSKDPYANRLANFISLVVSFDGWMVLKHQCLVKGFTKQWQDNRSGEYLIL